LNLSKEYDNIFCVIIPLLSMQKLMLNISNKGMDNRAIDIKHYVGTLKHFIHLRYLPLILEQKIANKKKMPKYKTIQKGWINL
jgi:hypothetical protein